MRESFCRICDNEGCCECGEAIDCNECGGEGIGPSDCIDDMCHGQDECMHGDPNPPCRTCKGSGFYWVSNREELEATPPLPRDEKGKANDDSSG